jgi:chemotaxis protein MotB
MSIKNKSHKEEQERHQGSNHSDDSNHNNASHDESNWLVSYADMMTLLCGFFILLFSMAKMDAPKYDSFREAVSKQFGGEYVSPSKEFAKYATQVIQELGVETPTIIKSDSNGVSIVFQSTVFFETLSSDVSPQGRKILDGLIESIKKRQETTAKTYKIVIEGHTDSRPITGGIYPSNWELSGSRAARVVRLFLAHGFLSKNLVAIGYADTHPQFSARTPAGTWDEQALAKNRRVVLRILEPQIDTIPFPDDTSSLPAAPQQPAQSANTAH